MRKFGIIILILFVLGLVPNSIVFASITDGTIDATYKYAWSENAGWMNFGCDSCNVHITDSGLTGYIWNENYGWINLNPSTSGVKNDSEGNLSGYAWGENLGWIDFDNVSINTSGKFTGTASGTISGIINFDCANCGVQTDWRPKSVRPVSSPGAISSPQGYYFPSISEEDLKFFIIPHIATSNEAVLHFKATPNVTKILISNNPTFLGAKSINYIPLYKWTLSGPAGKKTIYIKFCNKYNRCSEKMLADVIYSPSGLSNQNVGTKSFFPKVSIKKLEKDFTQKVSEIFNPLVSKVTKTKLPRNISQPSSSSKEDISPKENIQENFSTKSSRTIYSTPQKKSNFLNKIKKGLKRIYISFFSLIVRSFRFVKNLFIR